MEDDVDLTRELARSRPFFRRGVARAIARDLLRDRSLDDVRNAWPDPPRDIARFAVRLAETLTSELETIELTEDPE